MLWIILLICQQRFYSTFSNVFFIKNAFLTFFLLGIKVFTSMLSTTVHRSLIPPFFLKAHVSLYISFSFLHQLSLCISFIFSFCSSLCSSTYFNPFVYWLLIASSIFVSISGIFFISFPFITAVHLIFPVRIGLSRRRTAPNLSTYSSMLYK